MLHLHFFYGASRPSGMIQSRATKRMTWGELQEYKDGEVALTPASMMLLFRTVVGASVWRLFGHGETQPTRMMEVALVCVNFRTATAFISSACSRVMQSIW